jgi:diguanylate cyclase (GGDEF)-like protein/putative nucleotidyltransferase with HDIG domain/PAS domain S-box-containing protein
MGNKNMICETFLQHNIFWDVICDKENIFIYSSENCVSICGYRAKDFIDNNNLFASVIVEEDLPQWKKHIVDIRENEKISRVVIRIRHKKGHIIFMEQYAVSFFKDGTYAGYRAQNKDVTDIIDKEKTIKYKSNHDQLTGLFNRGYYDYLIEETDKDENYPIALIMADVNGLKLVNDAFGHIMGDELLKKVTTILEYGGRESDMIARTGGDEFVMILPKTDSQQADEIIQIMRDKMKQVKMDYVIVSVAFGAAVKEHPEQTMEHIYNLAEEHMYTNKLVLSKYMKIQTIRLAQKNLFLRDSVERKHSINVRHVCREIGIALKLNTNDINTLGLCGLFHDIGKINVNPEVLQKTGELTSDDWNDIKRHPEIGYQILRSSNEYAQVAEVALNHHERIDGTGYPRGLKGVQIDLFSRILSVADAYVAMTSEQHYREAMAKEEAAEELIRHQNTQFDPKIVKITTELLINNKI